MNQLLHSNEEEPAGSRGGEVRLLSSVTGQLPFSKAEDLHQPQQEPRAPLTLLLGLNPDPHACHPLSRNLLCKMVPLHAKNTPAYFQAGQILQIPHCWLPSARCDHMIAIKCLS